MIDFSEVGLFKTDDGKTVTYEDLLKDVYTNSQQTKAAMDDMLSKLSDMVEANPKLAFKIIENIADIMDARVKNDDILVKVAGIVSRIIQKGMGSVDSHADWEIPESERKQLLQEAEKVIDQARKGLTE